MRPLTFYLSRCMCADLEALIAMVPPKFYLPPDPDEVAQKFLKYTGKQQQSSRHDRKLASVERKRARLDPSKQLNAAEIQQQRDQAADTLSTREGRAKSVKRRNAEKPANPAQTEKSARDDGDSGGDDDGDEDRPQYHPVAGKPPLLAQTHVGDDFGDDGRLTSVNGLRQRLADKLAQMRGNRGGVPRAQRPEAAPKAKQPKHVAGGQNKHRPGERDDGNLRDASGDSHGRKGADASGASRGGAGGIEFNKLAAAEATSKGKRKLSTAALLAQAEEAERRRRARLSAPDGGGEDQQIEEWQRALQKAGGIKQKDNPTLLRKVVLHTTPLTLDRAPHPCRLKRRHHVHLLTSPCLSFVLLQALKREARKKKKSKEAWAARIKTVAKSMKDKQESRVRNLKERATKNKNRAAKMKARAGFEGKKSSFL